MSRAWFARHGRRSSALGAWLAAALLFVGGFALGLGAHQALVASGTRRLVFAGIAAVGAVVLLGLLVAIRRERPGVHAR